MAKSPVKIAITGGAGQIGYALLFRIASGEMFGKETPIELQLIELESSISGLRGVLMELEDCAFPLLKNILCTPDLNRGMRDANWVILVGAVPRKAGMERADLLKINGGIFTNQGAAINHNAASDVRILTVGNPCNTNSLIAQHHAPDVPAHRFFAMTALDELRARAQLAKKAGVDITAISTMTIWGNHSATQYPDFYHAKINGNPATQVVTDQAWLQNDFVTTVQQRGAEVIKARGASSAASAANAIISSVRCLNEETAVGESFSIVRCSEGEYGIDPGLMFSFPCRTEQGQLHVVQNLVHNTYGQQKLQATLEELRAERDAVKAMGLI